MFQLLVLSINLQSLLQLIMSNDSGLLVFINMQVTKLNVFSTLQVLFIIPKASMKCINKLKLVNPERFILQLMLYSIIHVLAFCIKLHVLVRNISQGWRPARDILWQFQQVLLLKTHMIFGCHTDFCTFNSNRIRIFISTNVTCRALTAPSSTY